MIDPDYDYERAELARIDAHQRRYHNRLTRHPDCRDPEHPGCPCCEPDEPWEREPLPPLYPDPLP